MTTSKLFEELRSKSKEINRKHAKAAWRTALRKLVIISNSSVVSIALPRARIGFAERQLLYLLGVALFCVALCGSLINCAAFSSPPRVVLFLSRS